MTAISVTTAYATPIEADQYLRNSDAWLDLDIEVKEDALLQARYFIDARYDFIVEFDPSNPQDEVKYASVLLASGYTSSGVLFNTSSAGIKKKSVKAGSVDTFVEYASPLTVRPSNLKLVDSVMSPVATANTGSVNLVRA